MAKLGWITLTVALLLVFTGTGWANGFSIDVDGRVLATESYQWVWQLGDTSNTNQTHKAQLYIGQEDLGGGSHGDVYGAFVLPKTYVDNTYGANQAYDWNNHTFGHLLNSDRAQFTFSKTGASNPILDVVFDYLDENPNNSNKYDSGLVGEGSIETGSSGDVVAVATSLDYNVNELPTGMTYLTDSPDTAATGPSLNYSDPDETGWVFEVIYEFRIAGSVFGGQQFVGDENGTVGFMNGYSMHLTMLHASPAKAGDFTGITPGEPDPRLPPTGLVPVPSAVWMGGGLLLTLAFLRHRRRTSASA